MSVATVTASRAILPGPPSRASQIRCHLSVQQPHTVVIMLGSKPGELGGVILDYAYAITEASE